MTGLVLVDDRLLHGRVTHGWCPSVQPDRIVIADDDAATDEWQREAYEASGPEGVAVEVLSLSEAADREASGAWDEERILLLVRSSETLAALIALGFSLTSATIGELHRMGGRREVRPGLWATSSELAAFARLLRMGVALTWRGLPTDEPRSFPHVSE